jgi:hypothetical protein
MPKYQIAKKRQKTPENAKKRQNAKNAKMP